MIPNVRLLRPTPVIFRNMLAVATCGRIEADHHLRWSVWHSLLQLRETHGSLAAARRAAEERRCLDLAPARGRA